jgi:hypothetical protein
MQEVRSIGAAIMSWRNALPVELRYDVTPRWGDSDVWVAVLHALSYRLECLFYRTLSRRAHMTSAADASYVNGCLLNAMFELSTVLRRAMAQGVLSAGPPSM